MQKSPDSPSEAVNVPAEGELPEAKLAEVSGGSLSGMLNSIGTAVTLNLVQLQNSANQAAQTTANLTGAATTFSNIAANSKNIG